MATRFGTFDYYKWREDEIEAMRARNLNTERMGRCVSISSFEAGVWCSQNCDRTNWAERPLSKIRKTIPMLSNLWMQVHEKL